MIQGGAIAFVADPLDTRPGSRARGGLLQTDATLAVVEGDFERAIARIVVGPAVRARRLARPLVAPACAVESAGHALIVANLFDGDGAPN